MSIKSTLTYLDDDESRITEVKEHIVTNLKYWECVSDVLEYYWSEGCIHYVDQIAIDHLGVTLHEVDNRNILQVGLEIQLDRHMDPPDWFKKRIFSIFDGTYVHSILWNSIGYFNEDICNERERLMCE